MPTAKQPIFNGRDGTDGGDGHDVAFDPRADAARGGLGRTDVAGEPLLVAGALAPPETGDELERRLHYRIPVMLEVDYRAADTFLFAYITDISAMGIFVRTASPEVPGTHLHLRFTPPGDEDAIECEGDVIWINPPREGRSRSPGMGIQLSDLSSEKRRHLVELVRTFAYLDVEDSKPHNCH